MSDGAGERSTRVPFHATVNLRFTDRDYRDCETRDLSVNGLFVVGVTTPLEGESCEAELCLAGTSSTLCLRMEARVARTTGEGFALRFTGMDIDSFFHLKNIVYFNASDPDEIVARPPLQEGGA